VIVKIVDNVFEGIFLQESVAAAGFQVIVVFSQLVDVFPLIFIVI
jgi:hypothetical protein